eukprot:CAMPEP_0174854022 /NCGR_PEP_ID=MMETSP1114-20130205/29716_1 /TAXON_ID=312471 /ORGANISM="Neobodo designis, Strain CCAP 1951/1" /LENGTH=163 /DNA_ID=CAMNT_0016088695 /DNA_START=137 /DNA_END=628 /DNA_ORIENTATION=-
MIRRSIAAFAARKPTSGRSSRAVSSAEVRVLVAESASVAKAAAERTPTVPEEADTTAMPNTDAVSAGQSATPDVAKPPAARPRRTRAGSTRRVVKKVKVANAAPRSQLLEGGLPALMRDYGSHITILTPDDVWTRAGVSTGVSKNANVLRNVEDVFNELPPSL